MKALKIRNIKTAWPENSTFSLERYVGNECIFIHMTTHALVSEKGILRDCPAGTCILYSPGAHQLLRAFPDGFVHDWMHISSDAKAFFSSYGLQTDTLYTLSEDGFVSELMREAELETLNPRPDSDALCELLLRELFLKLSRGVNNNRAESVSPSVREAFATLREKVHLQYEKEWTVEEMAALAHLCPSRFHNLYKHIFGISPKSDLLAVRLEHAKLFLPDESRTVKEVAGAVGYSNVYHFIRAFKKYAGVTPGQYRTAHIGEIKRSL